MISRRLFYSFILIATPVLLGSYAFLFWLVADLPHIPTDLRQLVYAQPTEIFADDGSLVYKLGGQSFVPIDEISPYFLDAVIAAEDKNFRRHHGIDKLALFRAAYATLFRGQIQGGSTITQQLAKNLFFSFQRLFLRKLKEILIAVQLERTFSKNEILEAYCNLIYFGGTAYGVEDAAQQFFSKSARALTLSEAAFLAGIINSPLALNPLSHPEAAKRRHELILARMLDRKFIDEAEYAAAIRDTLHFIEGRYRSNDFIDYTLSVAEERYGREALYFGGLKIYTSLDADLQRAAEEELSIGVQRLQAEMDSTGEGLQGAMAVVSIATGEVKALVGARRHVPGGFNRAVSSNRHVGSGIKPFIYYGAFERLGESPRSVVVDSAATFFLDHGKSWRPRNFDREYHGRMIVKAALVNSVNLIAAQFGSRLTPPIMKEILRRFGISSEIPEVLPLALGTAGISPLEMAEAYAVFARNGIYYAPTIIKRVEDVNGTVLDRAFNFGEQRLDEKLSYEVLDMMMGVIDEGTGRSVRLAGFSAPAAGKTGTSTSYTDAWFTGVTTSLAASVWIGYDKIYQLYTREGHGVTGGYAAGPVWANFMKRAAQRYPARPFAMPEGLRRIYVDPIYGLPVFDPENGLPVVVDEQEARRSASLMPVRQPVRQLQVPVDSTRLRRLWRRARRN